MFRKVTSKKNADFYQNRRGTHYNKSDFDKAILDYTKALKLNPAHTVAQNNLKNILDSIRNKEVDRDLLFKIEKSDLFKAIKKLPSSEQISLLNECLDQTTVLGSRFWKKEGFFRCNLKNGTLNEIYHYLKQLTNIDKNPQLNPTCYQELFEINAKKIGPR